jgi:hypothetical protein
VACTTSAERNVLPCSNGSRGIKITHGRAISLGINGSEVRRRAGSWHRWQLGHTYISVSAWLAVSQNIQVVLRKSPEEKRSNVVLPFPDVCRLCDSHVPVLDVVIKRPNIASYGNPNWFSSHGQIEVTGTGPALAPARHCRQPCQDTCVSDCDHIDRITSGWAAYAMQA